MPSTIPLSPPDTPAVAEAALVARARDGDRAAFEAIVRRYERPIYSLTYRMMGNADDAFDLTQETFVKAYRALGRTRGELRVAAWLHRIAANGCLDVLRRRGRLRWLPWDGPKHDHRLLCGPADEPEQALAGAETRAAVQRVLDRMSARHRLGLLLREYEGLSCAEIGEVMGLSRPAVKSMLHRARLEFRAMYAAAERADPPPGAARSHRQPEPVVGDGR
jgi:RNA polymerase sigma-70 factor (ECF subfamily)